MPTVVAVIDRIALAVLIVTAMASVAFRRLLNANRAALISGGLFVPALMFAWGFYDLAFNLEVDGPPPGMLLIGGLIMIAVICPVTFLISFLTLEFASNRADRSDR